MLCIHSSPGDKPSKPFGILSLNLTLFFQEPEQEKFLLLLLNVDVVSIVVVVVVVDNDGVVSVKHHLMLL